MLVTVPLFTPRDSAYPISRALAAVLIIYGFADHSIVTVWADL